MQRLELETKVKPHFYFHGNFWWCRAQHVTGMGKTMLEAWNSMKAKLEKLERTGVTSYCVMLEN